MIPVYSVSYAVLKYYGTCALMSFVIIFEKKRKLNLEQT